MATQNTTPARYCTHGYGLCILGADGILRHDAAALQALPPTDPRALAYLADPINRKLAEDLGAIEPATAILAYSRFDGQPLALVQSATDPNVRHIVTMGGQCSCKSYTYRDRCRHTGEAAPQRPAGTPLIGRLSA